MLSQVGKLRAHSELKHTELKAELLLLVLENELLQERNRKLCLRRTNGEYTGWTEVTDLK